ncbi:hypothetical protein GA0074692_0857 [Micromonospora pallida]|uniref:Uncharacterized protein n=1 Tax=Micromonospora pallida TaxID=145854 RepID=A0A1C6RT72_9ACTN|nr:hypothetical protein [Micromonospora pallida]SCL20393.1 hypothetical protein GA0074692_0857 [Micromonospora pallida]
MFRILAVSIRGHRYLEGNPTSHPITEVPPGVGTRFPSLTAVKQHVQREYRSLSVVWRVEVIDERGEVVSRGTRDGVNGTGSRWVWQTT